MKFPVLNFKRWSNEIYEFRWRAIELLMNDKVKEGGSKPTSDIHIDDLDNLENELNDLVGEDFPSRNTYESKSSLFGKSENRVLQVKNRHL